MLLLTLFLTATVLATRDRGDGNHGDNQCTQDLGAQNADLRCLLQPFTGPIDGCGDSPSATSTTCSLRVDGEWPHADAVGDVSLRRLLSGRGGRTNIARIDVTEQALSEVVLRSGRRRNPDYTCMGSSSTLTISSVVVHDLAEEGETEGESASDNAGEDAVSDNAGEDAVSENAGEGEIAETEGEGDNPDADGDFERTDGAFERTFWGANTGAEGEDGPRDDFEGEEVDGAEGEHTEGESGEAENSEGAEGENTERESGEAESAGEDADSGRGDFEGAEGEGGARGDFEGGESDSDSFEGGEGERDFEGRRALDAEESESPYATITFTQTNTDAEGNVVSFDLTMDCRVAYRRNGCSVRGLLCQDGEYTFLAGSDDGSTEEITENFRMTCRDPTQLEGQTFPQNWDVDACNEN